MVGVVVGVVVVEEVVEVSIKYCDVFGFNDVYSLCYGVWWVIW